jgi:hypothetical protein
MRRRTRISAKEILRKVYQRKKTLISRPGTVFHRLRPGAGLGAALGWMAVVVITVQATIFGLRFLLSRSMQAAFPSWAGFTIRWSRENKGMQEFDRDLSGKA